VKWVRFYLDFCHKYNFRQKEPKSLSAFMKKLKEKSNPKNRESRHTMPLYFMLNWFFEPQNRLQTILCREKISPPINLSVPRKKYFVKKTNSWKA